MLKKTAIYWGSIVVMMALLFVSPATAQDYPTSPEPSVTGLVMSSRGDLLDSSTGFVQVTLLRMTEEGWLNYESWLNEDTGNCQVKKGKFTCWEGQDTTNGNRLTPGDYRVEIFADGMQVFSKGFRYYGTYLDLGNLVVEPLLGIYITEATFNGRRVNVTVEVESIDNQKKGKSFEICATARGRGINTYDVIVPFGCQMVKKGRQQAYSFQLPIPKDFPEGFWVNYKFTVGEVGNPWEFSGEVWGYTLIRRR
jgi:hypothetical protein